jgi:hypothetical protein
MLAREKHSSLFVKLKKGYINDYKFWERPKVPAMHKHASLLLERACRNISWSQDLLNKLKNRIFADESYIKIVKNDAWNFAVNLNLGLET